jgi:O-methyltransferase
MERVVMIENEGFDAPRQAYSRLRKLIPKALQSVLRGLRKRASRTYQTLEEPYRSVFPYTQCHPVRQEHLLRLAKDIERMNLEGEIVECGVLDGGTAALMAYATARSGRNIHLFDSWSGLPSTSEKDGEASKVWANDIVGSPKRVAAVMQSLQINPDRIVFHRGWFNETFPKVEIDQISLLHIDADFYDSVKLSLETWVPHVVPGGYIQIDDYSAFIGCRKAVDEYLAAHPELELKGFGQHTKAYHIQMSV